MDTTTLSPDLSSGLPPGSIIVGVDGSDHSDAALDWATDQARIEHRPLVLAFAAPASVAAHTPIGAAHERVAARAPGLEMAHLVRAGDPASLLATIAQSAALVVVGSHGRGPVTSRLLGSVGLALARRTPCPVLVHRPWHPGRVRRGVVAGVDGSERSTAVLEAAYRLASQRDLPLRVLHCGGEVPTALMAASGWVPPVSDVEADRALLSELVAGLQEKYPDVHATAELVAADAAAVLSRESDHSDVVVIGRHHGDLVTTLLTGSVTTEVVERAACPVLVVPTA